MAALKLCVAVNEKDLKVTRDKRAANSSHCAAYVCCGQPGQCHRRQSDIEGFHMWRKFALPRSKIVRTRQNKCKKDVKGKSQISFLFSFYFFFFFFFCCFCVG